MIKGSRLLQLFEKTRLELCIWITMLLYAETIRVGGRLFKGEKPSNLPQHCSIGIRFCLGFDYGNHLEKQTDS